GLLGICSMRSDSILLSLLLAACGGASSDTVDSGASSSGSGAGGAVQGTGGGEAQQTCAAVPEGPIVAVDVAAFDSGAMAALSDGSVWCWGFWARPWRAVCGGVVDDEHPTAVPRRR